MAAFDLFLAHVVISRRPLYCYRDYVRLYVCPSVTLVIHEISKYFVHYTIQWCFEVLKSNSVARSSGGSPRTRELNTGNSRQQRKF